MPLHAKTMPQAGGDFAAHRPHVMCSDLMRHSGGQGAVVPMTQAALGGICRRL
jgi:hypothetical protein